jgi:hypothetical protein
MKEGEFGGIANEMVGRPLVLLSFLSRHFKDPDPILRSVTHNVNTTFTDRLEEKRKLLHVDEIYCTIYWSIITACGTACCKYLFL